MFALQVLNKLCTHNHVPNIEFDKDQTRIELRVFASDVRFPSECFEEVQRQRRLLWDAAAFLLSNQIPAVVSIGDVQVYPVHEV